MKGKNLPPALRRLIEVVLTPGPLALLTRRRNREAELEALNRDLEQQAAERAAEVREMRDKLSAANAALEKATRLNDEFLASMSHELRTPLTGILGLSEALELQTFGPLNDRQLKSVKTIESSGRHLLELINDILDLSRIEAGRLDLQIEPCSIAEICKSSLQLVKGMAHQKKQNISFCMNPVSITLNGDARRMKQMLVNLLSNAVKFTAEGGKLGLEVAGSEEEGLVRLTVWDQGIGIQAEDLGRLFKPFVQLDSSLTRQYTGTGLGLSLVQRLAELHAGSIQVESVYGEGSRFTILLPWQVSAAGPAAGLEDSSAPTGPLVMIADDNEVILDRFSSYLKANRFRVFCVRSGFELLSSAAEIHPDLILMDIQMPGLDGLETTRRVRAHNDPALAKTPIIATTGLAVAGDREKCLEAGANEYLSKPVVLNRLVEKIKALL
jgi:signal transduction histidine kinase/CheY-like chemotaxis protein